MTVRITSLPEPETVPAPDGGLGALITNRGNLPLDTVDVRAAITGLAASVEVTQGFRNPFDVPLEATYVFPLPDRAAVTGLRMEAADRIVEGVLKERGQARQDYDTAIAAGKRAAIAEEDRPDVFSMRVGNILPGERVTVRLTLDQPLPYETDDGAATFRFPLVVAPRYIPGAPLDGAPAGPGTAPDTDAAPDASRITPPVLLPGFPNPVRLSITAEIDPAGLPLAEIRSALHVTSEEDGTSGTTVRLLPGERLDRDFLLRLAYTPQEDRPAAALALTPDTGTPAGSSLGNRDDSTGDDANPHPASDAVSPHSSGGTFTLTVLPSGTGRPRPRDVVLVLDRSGSMHGWKMIAARRAASRIVDTLTGADRFAVLSFDNTVERPRALGPGLADGTDRNRFRAVEHLAALDARGGTEMLAPLEEACGMLFDSARDRVLVLITDGQVGNEDQILARLTPRLRGVRVHTVGIDRAVNAGFLTRLAEAGQGRCELVESEDRLDEVMDHIHHRIGAPLVTDLSLHPEGLTLVPGTVAPGRLGALFPGVPLVISGRYEGAPTGSLTVRGTTPDGAPWAQQAHATRTDGSPATSIWARAHLRDLEDRYAVADSPELEKRIVDTSLRFNVLCRFTAFVAVDDQVATGGEIPHQVVQPVELPQGWGAAPMMAAMPRPMAPGATAAAPAMAPPPAPAPGSPPPPMPPMPRGSGRPPAGGTGYGSADLGSDDMDVPDFLADGPKIERRSRRNHWSRRSNPAASTELTQARQRLTEELTRLRELQSAPQDQRRDHLLAHLLPVLQQVIDDLSAQTPESLTLLLDALQAAATAAPLPPHLDELWAQAVDTLQSFTGSAPARPFWKRRP
ncbi:VIT domain-containing protein [Actinomadura hibisca]|uniref:VIT domain-containing protein n=1 Tax=Actinomadura hibisca TaxID=68565 RepID=UPI00082B2661|nr:VIT domain-containing protein [Actinomadura hibisca]